MAAAFNLTAQINLQGPNNLKPIVSKIKKELGNIKASVNLDIKGSSIKNLTAATSKLNNLTKAATNANASIVTLNQSLSTLATNFNNISSTSSASIANINNTVKAVSSVKKAVNQTTSEIEEFGKQSGLAIRRFAAFSVATGAVYAFTSALSSAFKEFVVFNKEVVRLSQVTGQSTAQLKSVTDEITRLSTGLGVASADLLTVTTTLAQAGLSAQDTRVALEALAKSSLAPSFENIQDTTEGAIAAIRQFGLQTYELEAALGSINAVAAAFAVESGDIITAIQRTGGVFASSSKGVSEGTDALNEFIAVFTSVRATTRESAETIATGLRTIFTRVQRGRTIDFLKQFKIELTDMEGKFVGPYEAVKRLSEGLQGLDPRDLRFSQIVEELGGFRQIGKVIPLIQQFATAEQALGVAQRGTSSLTKDAATAQESLAVQFTKTREAFLALVRDLGESTAFQSTVGITLNLANSLITLAGALKPILPLLATFAAIKIGSGLRDYATGFSRGFGGGRGGAGGIPPVVPGGGGPAPTVGGGPAAASISANTSAISNLNNLVSALSQHINTLNTTINKTNAILATRPTTRGFATGGLVPGSGNRDTIPARLTPGEFVIRKKAVEAIGADNLHHMNKYAAGGRIFQQDRVGAAILKFQNPNETTPVSEQDIITSSKPNNKDALKSIFEGINKQYTVVRAGLSKDLRNQFNKAIDSGIMAGVNRTVRSLFESGGGQEGIFAGLLPPNNPAVSGTGNKKNFLASINAGAKATFFEEILTRIENQGVYSDREDANRPFDFMNGLQVSSSKLFPALSGIQYVDAKSSASAAKVKGGRKSIAAKIGSQIILENSGQLSGTAIGNTAKNQKILSALMASNNIQKGMRITEINGLPGLNSVKIRDLETLAKQPDSPIIVVKQGGFKVAKAKQPELRAAGGSISGEDTVPALLTPGEFVVNKESAQRIGYANLHKMNRADRVKGFNKGGIVGYAKGGGVSAATGGVLVLSALQYQINELVSGFKGLDSAAGQAAKGFIQGSVSFAASAKLAGEFFQTTFEKRMINRLAAGSAILGGVGGAVSAYTNKSLEDQIKVNTNALNAFNKKLEEAKNAPTEKLREESLKDLENSFISLTKTFNENKDSIQLTEGFSKLGQSATNAASALVTVTTTLMLLGQQARSIQRSSRISAAATGAAGAAGAASLFGSVTKGLVGFGASLTKLAGPIGLAISGFMIVYDVVSIFTSSLQKSSEQSLAHAEALKELVANTREYNISNKEYTDVTLSLAKQALSLRNKAVREGEVTPQIRAFGEITPSNIPGLPDRTTTTGINPLNISALKFFQSQLAQQVPTLGNIDIETFASLSKENADIVAKIIAQKLPEYIDIQFQRVQKERPELVTGKTDEQKRIAVERFTGEEVRTKMIADIAKRASKEIQIQTATLTNIFSELSSTFKAAAYSISNEIDDLNSTVDIFTGETKMQPTPIYERASKTLSNLQGSSEKDIEFALGVADRLINNQLGGEQQKVLNEALQSIRDLRLIERDLPTILESIQTQGLSEDSLSEQLDKYFGRLIKDDKARSTAIENMVSIINSNSRQGQPTLNREQIAATSQEFAKILEGANIPLKSLIENLDIGSQSAKQLADAQQRLIDVTNNQRKFISEVNRARLESNMDLRRARGEEVSPLELNKLFEEEIKGIVGQDVSIKVNDLVREYEMATQELKKFKDEQKTDPGKAAFASNKERKLVEKIDATRKALEMYAKSIELSKNITEQLNQENAKSIKNRDAFFKIFTDLRNPGGMEKYNQYLTLRSQINEAVKTKSAKPLGQTLDEQEQKIQDFLEIIGDFDFALTENEANQLRNNVLDAMSFAVTPESRKKIQEEVGRSREKASTIETLGAFTQNADIAAKAIKDANNQAIITLTDSTSKLSRSFIDLEKILGDIITRQNNIVTGLAPQPFQQQSFDKTTALQLRLQFGKQFNREFSNPQKIIDEAMILGNPLSQGFMRFAEGNQSTQANFDPTKGFKGFSGHTGFEMPTNADTKQLIADFEKAMSAITAKGNEIVTPQDYTNLEKEIIALYQKLYDDLAKVASITPAPSGMNPKLFLSGAQRNADIMSAIRQQEETARQEKLQQQQLQKQQEEDRVRRQLPPGIPNKPTGNEFMMMDSKTLLKPFNQFFNNVISSFGIDIDKFDTTIKSLAALFPTLDAPMVKFERSVDKLVARLDRLESAGGIKGPTIPEEVKVSVSFDDTIQVVADGVNNDNILAQVERVTYNTVVQELKKIQAFGNGRTFTKDSTFT